MKYKKFTKILLLLVLILLLLPALVVFIVDPIQLYHTQISLQKEQYFKEQRHQNIGLINKFLYRSNKNYNTIILGSSLSENFLPSKVENILNNNNKVLKLALSGGQPIEYEATLKKALDSKRIKTVYWEINRNYMFKEIKSFDKNHDFPYKLYSNNPIEQGYYYLFNDDYLKHAISVFTGRTNGNKWSNNLDKLNYWMSGALKSTQFNNYSSNKNIKELNQNIIKSNNKIRLKTPLDNFKYLDKYILDIIKEYPNIQFNLWFPPYSTYYYRSSNNTQVNRVISAKKYLVKTTENMNNINIYGFDNEFNIINNIYNYKDYGHYRSDINDYMIKSIISNKHKLSKDNIDLYLYNLIQNIHSYNKVYVNKEINYSILKNLDFNDIKNKNKNLKIFDNKIKISAKDIKKNLATIIHLNIVNNIDGIKLRFQLPKEKLKMISFSLNNKNGWAHFFTKPELFNDGIIKLTKNNISKEKNFNFQKIKSLTIRLYPIDSKIITNFIIDKIETIKFKNYRESNI